MAYNKTIWVNDNLPAINAENLNNIENGVESAKNVTDNILQIGDVYFTSTSDNPSERLGGTWELVRSFYGGELVAFGSVWNSSTNSKTINEDVITPFSDISGKKSDITNYVDDILSFNSGTFMAKPKGIVGMFDVQMFITGSGGSGLKALWFKGNAITLPTGVSCLPIASGNGVMGTMTNGGFGGTNVSLFYKIDDTASEDTQFYINPVYAPYGGSLIPASAGTKCCLLVKAYAKGGTNYMWKKVA